MTSHDIDDGELYGVLLNSFDRKEGEQVRMYYREFRGEKYLDIRIFYLAEDGFRPTKKGVRIRQKFFPEFMAGIRELVELVGLEQ